MLSDLMLEAGEKEIESQVKPLWLAHFIISKMTGTETKEWDSFIKEVKKEEKIETKKQRTAEEIMKDFEAIVKAERGGE